MINDGSRCVAERLLSNRRKSCFTLKFGFYEGHLNAYNRDYWKEDEKRNSFEDGTLKRKSERQWWYQRTLNGEKEQLSVPPLVQ